MGNETKNYKFPKPSEDDFYDISEYNKAMDILDETLTGMSDRKLDRDGNASNVVTEFSQEILRNNIVSGEKLSVSHGKIQKWFSEMKNIAFSGLASDATQDAAHRFVTDTEKSNWNAKVSASGGDISGTKIGLLETITSEFPVPSEGETSKMFLGKVKKFIQDFNNFKTGIITVGKLVNNGQTTAAGYALDARYGKTLYDMYTQLNADLSYKVISSGDILTLDRGFYYAYPSCNNLPPDTGEAFWLSVNKVDNNNKIIDAVPAGAGYKYYYKAKKSEGVWQGWNKYPESTKLLGYLERQYVFEASAANTEQLIAWWAGEPELKGKTLVNVYASIVEGWTNTIFTYSPPYLHGENIGMRFSVAQKYTIVLKYQYLQ